jgi:hypothetical protein
MELTEQAIITNEFDKGYHFGRQELLYFLLSNAKYRELKDDEFCITLDTLMRLQKEEIDKNGNIKQ